MAYKRVRPDFKDWHSNTLDNSVGNILEMPRYLVDDNQSVGCSKGLHAGSLDYINGFHSNDGVVVIVKIDPKDVVCIPNEDVRKLRCCRYEVLSTFKSKLTAPTYTAGGDVYVKPTALPDEDVEDDLEDEESECNYPYDYEDMSQW